MLNALLWNLLLTTGLAVALAALCRLPWLASRPALRHSLWLLLLAKLVTPPVIAVPLLPAVTDSSHRPAVVAMPPSPPLVQHVSGFDLRAGANPAFSDTFFSAADGRRVDAVPPREPRCDTGGLLLGGLLAISLAGTCVLLTLEGVQAVRLFRRLKRAGTENALLAESCARVASRLAIRRVVRTCVVDARTTPLLCAWRQPLVVMPRQLMDSLTPQQLHGIVAHELAHLLRRDHWANLFVAVVKSLVWWNPVVWWADRELRAAQELCCDTIAIDCCNADRRGYATTLLAALDFIQGGSPAPRALAAGMGSNRTILRRFEMIGQPQLSYRLSRGAFLMLLALSTPLVCMPVRAEERPAVPATSATADAGVKKDGPVREEAAKTGGVEENKNATRLVGPPSGQVATLAFRFGTFLGQVGASLGRAQAKPDPAGRPHGNCSISGKVVSATTGQPVARARVYLFYLRTFAPVFAHTESDGSFSIKDIPVGPFSLRTSHTAGYLDSIYNPEGKSGPFPQFSLHEGEQRSGIVFKIHPACRIAGKVLDENGKIPARVGEMTVMAWFERDEGKTFDSEHVRAKADGSYLIDGLSHKPAYVMVINWNSDKESDIYPPVYYPSTFSRADAKRITFDKGPSVEHVDIRLRKQGGLVLEGTITDEAGKPVPEAFIVAHHRDMFVDFITAYSDQQGKYTLHGLGSGELLVHVDAAHRGYVRIRTPVDLDGATKATQRSFTLSRGVMISGKFVDDQGHDWRIAESYGDARVVQKEKGPSGSFTLTGFRSKYAPPDVSESSGSSFLIGEGPYDSEQMVFPTAFTFLIQGMMPGRTMLSFSPQKEGQKTLKILDKGRDIMQSGIETRPGEEIKDVTIVIGER